MGKTEPDTVLKLKICFSLNSAFWNKDEFNDKMLHSSQTENCPFTLGPTIYIENVNENCIDNICESSRTYIVQVHNYLVSSVANPHWFVKYVKSCNAEEFDHGKINYGNMYGEVQLYSIVTKCQSKTSQNHKNTHKCVNYSLYNAQWCNIPPAKVIQFYHYKCIFMQNQESCTSLHISVMYQVLDNVFVFVN